MQITLFVSGVGESAGINRLNQFKFPDKLKEIYLPPGHRQNSLPEDSRSAPPSIPLRADHVCCLMIGVENSHAGRVVGVVMLGAVRIGLAQEAAADVVVPVGAVSLGIVEILQGSAVSPVIACDAV